MNIDMTKEIWVPCIASNKYEISNWGRCRNIDTGKNISCISRSAGNLIYSLFDNNRCTVYTAKYLIYESFYGPVPKGSYVKLKEQDSLRLDNLFLHTPAHVSFDTVIYKCLKDIVVLNKEGLLQHCVFKYPLKIGSDGSINGSFSKSKDAYFDKYVTLKNNTSKHFRVHRLVAAAFLPDYSPYKVVNHIDHDTHNNDISNLECVDSEDNSYHTYNVSKPIDTSFIYELKDENDEIYGCFHTFEEASREMQTYLIGGGIMHINAYSSLA